MLTEAQITKFQEIYERRFGEKIDRDRALNMGIELVQLVKLIYRPIKKKSQDSN